MPLADCLEAAQKLTSGGLSANGHFWAGSSRSAFNAQYSLSCRSASDREFGHSDSAVAVSASPATGLEFPAASGRCGPKVWVRRAKP